MHTDRLTNIVQVYLEGQLELDTAAAELTHVYVERGWGFYLVEVECYPEHREQTRALASRMETAMLVTAAARKPQLGRRLPAEGNPALPGS